MMAACTAGGDEPEMLRAEVIDTLPFNTTYFTQGLEVDPANGSLLVGTGGYGNSGIRRIDPATAEEVDATDMSDSLFGEGLTQTDQGIWQLTWKDHVAFLHNSDNLAVKSTADTGPDEGWGLCELESSSSPKLAMSHGTSEITFRDPETLAEIDRFDVTHEGKPVDKLNELECAGDSIYANVWMSTDILRIDSRTGKVTAVIDASALPNNAANDPNNVLNGIAAIPDTAGEEFYLTGKRWPDLYRVRFVPDDSGLEAPVR